MITFNDENEDYIRIDNFKFLLNCKQLKIFKKFLFILNKNNDCDDNLDNYIINNDSNKIV